MVFLYIVLIAISAIFTMSMAAAINYIGKQSESFVFAKVIAVDKNGSIVESVVNGESKTFKLDLHYPVGAEITIMNFNDDSEDATVFYPESLGYTGKILTLSTIISVIYLVCLIAGVGIDFSTFILVFAGIFCLSMNGIFGIVVKDYVGDSIINLNVEYVSEEKLELENGVVKYSPTFKYKDGEEEKYLTNLKYLDEEKIQAYKNGPKNVRYNKDINGLCLSSRWNKFRVICMVFLVISLGLFALAILL